MNRLASLVPEGAKIGIDTSPSELVGSPPYAAPEQVAALGTPFSDERSDVFGLGSILFEMLSGKRFSPGATLPGRVPRELVDVVGRATATEPRSASRASVPCRRRSTPTATTG